MSIAEMRGAQSQAGRRRRPGRVRSGARRVQAVRPDVVPRGASDARCSSAARSRISASRDLLDALGRHGAVAARAEGRQAHGRGRRSPACRPSCSRSRPTWTRTTATASRSCGCARASSTRGMKVKQVRTGKTMSAAHAAVLLRPGPRARRGGLCRRRGRHSQSRQPAHRRHADRGRGHQLHRRAELRAGNSAPACGCPTP